MIVAMATGVTTVADDAAIVANIDGHRSPGAGLSWHRCVFHVKQKSPLTGPC
jgi:hypothetical protein